MKQSKIFETIASHLVKEDTIHGIMLMGSVAQGTTYEKSDLDIMILGDSDKFSTETIDGILVEYIYRTTYTAKQRLMNDNMDMYHYLDNKIIYDKHGDFARLMLLAVERYNSYVTPIKEKKQILHWLRSVKIKLESSLNANDRVTTNFLVATNSWKVMEGIWAVNDIPMPPSGSVLKLSNRLTKTPCDWITALFSESEESKAIEMLKIIQWLIPSLDNHIS